MNWFKNLKIPVKIISGFVLVALIAAVVGAVGITDLKKSSQSNQELYTRITVPVEQLTTITANFQRARVVARDMIIANDPAVVAVESAKVPAKMATISEIAATMDQSIVAPKARAAFDDFLKLHAANLVQLNKVVELAKSNQDESALAMLGDDGAAGQSSNAEQDAIEILVQEIVAEGKAMADANSQNTADSTTTMLIVIFLGMLGAIVLGFIISAVISRPLKFLEKEAEKLAVGNTDVIIKSDTTDEIGSLFASVAKIVENIHTQAKAAEKISAGDLTSDILPKSDQDILAISMHTMVTTLRALVAETGTMVKAAVDGQLDNRGNSQQFTGGYRDIVEGINHTLDAVIGPLHVAADYVDRISKGDIPAKITDRYLGDFNAIKDNLNQCIDAVNAMVSDADMLSQAAVRGQLDTRADADRHLGEFRKIVQGSNNILNSIVGNLEAIPTPLQFMDQDLRIQYINQSGADLLRKTKKELSGTKCADVWGTKSCQTADCPCSQAMRTDGVIETENTARIAGHEMDFFCAGAPLKDQNGKIIGAFEFIMDQTKVKQAARLSQKVADFQAEEAKKLTKELHELANGDLILDCNIADGDEETAEVRSVFVEIWSAVQKSCDGIQQLVDDSQMLAEATLAGKLDIRADVSKHGGDFATIIQGVNDTLDAVIGPLNMAAEYVDRISKGDIPPKIADNYNGDFNAIKNNLNQCIDAVNSLVADADQLSSAAVAGQLANRADAAKHNGDFAKIIQGVNNTLDSVIGPLNMAAAYVDRISKGDIPPKIVDNYNGDFNAIKNNLNQCIDAVNSLVADADQLSTAAVAGNLANRADASKHNGDFARIIQGVNNTLDSVIGPLNMAAEYVDRISRGDMPPKIVDDYNGDFNAIKNNLNTCIDCLSFLVIDVSDLLKVAGDYKFIESDGDYRSLIDASKYTGSYHDIIESVFSTLNLLYEWVYWYEQALDAVPFAIYCTDKNMRVNFLNKTMEEYLGQNRAEATFKQCDVWQSPICNTDKCSITCLKKNQLKTGFEKNGKTFAIDVAYVYDKAGNQNGQLELIRDVTASTNVERYQNGEVKRLADNLQLLANGDINFDLAVAAGDEFTTRERDNFTQINGNLAKAKNAVARMVDDAHLLTQAAIAGQLSARADAAQHTGDFKKIIQGVNETLDAMIKPVNEAAGVLKEMAAGNLQNRMVGDYRGDHAEIKIALNESLDAVASYVTEISQVLTEMANSNLDIEISGDYKGDFSQIKEALNLIIISLNQVLINFNSTADEVATGSRQVSDGSQALSQGATEQASSIEQLTASINEIASQTKQNAINANEANSLAGTAQINAVQGNSQMKEMLIAMEEINVSSANISKIIKVIDEIAFQTNILALNAAVEAARAGQHGKGFAVVAEEVRNLAARSASAAKETTGLIEGSIAKVTAGTKIANDTAGALDRIVSDVAKAATLVGSIAVASNEQATGIAQINQGVEQVAQVVQTNSATAEESAAASEELSSQAELLKEMINGFRLKGEDNRQNRKGGSQKLLGSGSPGRKKSSSRIALSDQEFGKY